MKQAQRADLHLRFVHLTALVKTKVLYLLNKGSKNQQ